MKLCQLMKSAVVVVTLAALSACSNLPSRQADPSNDMPVLSMEPANMVDMLASSGQFTKLLAALEAAGLADAVRGGTFTLFAPTDAAFDALPDGVLDAYLLPANKGQLQTVLRYHLLVGEFDSARLGGMNSVSTVMGKKIGVSSDGLDLFVEGIRANPVDIEATNGVVHVIDTVLIPQ